MKILKYIFLLILLAFFTLTIFIATQKGEFNVERSIVIKSPKPTVFAYINDFRNWETFGSWKKEDPGMKFYYPQNTAGKGAFYSWKGSNGNGDYKTIDVKDNESIHQTTNYDGTVSDVFWIFKDTLGGTKVSWHSKGKMGFAFKIYSALHGGPDKVIGTMYQKSLANLDKTLDYEINTFNIKVNGVVEKAGCFYVKQTITSTIANVPKNLRIMIPQLINFFKKNHLEMAAKPFVLYHTFDRAKGITKLSVCIPVKQLIFTSPGSDISSGNLAPFQAVKTTLTGDYSHLRAAWDKTTEYMNTNHLNKNENADDLELYATSMAEIANPSKWVTEIYMPIKSKEAPVNKPKPAIIEVAVPTTPATVVPEP